MTVGHQLTRHLRATVGYTFLYWSDVVRPGSQASRVLNPTQLPPNALQGPALPVLHFEGTDFWAMGLNFGLDFEY